MKIKEILTFHFGLKDKNYKEYNNTAEYLEFQKQSFNFSKEFYKSLDLQCFSGCWSRIDINSGKFTELTDKAKDLNKTHNAIFKGIFQLEQILEDSNDIEWYQLKPKASINEFTKWTSINGIEYEKIKAYLVDKNINIAHGIGYNHYVSENFIAICKKFKFTGIEFIWIKDIGKYKAKQWYYPIALNPLGRGVNNPLDKTNKYKKLFKLEEISESKLSIHSFRCFCKNEIPDSDFAFIWNSDDSQSPNRLIRERSLCFNRKVKDILIKENIIKPSEIEPLCIKTNVQSIENSYDLPCPLYTKDELEVLKKYLARYEQEQIKNPKPIKVISRLELLKKIKSKNKTINIESALAALNRLKINLEIFRFYNSLILKKQVNNELELLENSELEKYTSEFIKEYHNLYPKITENITIIGLAGNGDKFGMKTIGTTNTFKISHETCDFEYKWDTIEEFLLDMYTGFYQ